MLKAFNAMVIKRTMTTTVLYSSGGKALDNRESASENKYVREHDQEKLKKLRKENKEKSKKDDKSK